MKPLFAFILFFSFVFHCVAQKKSKIDLLADQTELVYEVNFKEESYLFKIKVSNKKKIVIDYRIEGGSNILSGFEQYNKLEDIKNNYFAIPGFNGSEIEPNYFVMPLSVAKNIFDNEGVEAKFAVSINNDFFTISQLSIETYLFVEKSKVGMVSAIHYAMTKKGNKGLVGQFSLHFSDRSPVILSLSYEDPADENFTFNMNLLSIN